MIIIHNIPDETILPSVAATGFFDGVHKGHRYLIEQVKNEAWKREAASMVITFPVHPRVVMDSRYKPELLTTYEEKLALLESTGIDYCVVLDFTPEMSRLSAKEFTETISKQFNIQGLVIGHDHRFGHNRSEGFEDYRRFGKELGIDIIQACAYKIDGTIVSSSVIRRLLQKGEVHEANKYLGRIFYLEGIVIGGHRIGRTLGFPTANLKIEPCKILPADGVYAARVSVAGKEYAGMLNIGHRPTLDNGSDRTIEVHILHFHADIYDFPVRLTFIKYIRPEMKFPDKEGLREQLRKDTGVVEAVFSKFGG